MANGAGGAQRRAYESRIGKVIDGKYRLDGLLGYGATGAVYRALNTWVGRDCAVKLFHYEGDGKDALLQRFIREAQAANRVKKDGRAHPNVVDAVDVGRDPGTGNFFVVQELLHGETLEAYLNALPTRRLEVGEAAGILVPIIDAMAWAHAAGIVHRDLKPANIFLVDQGERQLPLPKVLDFGIAQLADARMTAASELMGTPEYMSPESFQGASGVDARADVWALGVMLYELVAGTTPFPLRAGGPFAVMRAIATEDPPSLIDQGLMRPGPWAVVRRALCRDPAGRYATARELLDALDEVLFAV